MLHGKILSLMIRKLTKWHNVNYQVEIKQAGIGISWRHIRGSKIAKGRQSVKFFLQHLKVSIILLQYESWAELASHWPLEGPPAL